MKMNFKVAVVSDVGLVRKNNEDNFFVPNIDIKPMQQACCENYAEFAAEKAYICVCDGMGGHSNGEVASYMAARETEKSYIRITGDQVKNKNKLNSVMQDFIADTNDNIYNRTEEDVQLKTMGTTMTGLYFMNNKAYFVNVGDSRSYELKKSRIKQLSVDHADPSSKNAITRFLGMSSEYGRMEADIAYVPSKVNTGNRYLLCSDGLTDMLSDKEIAGIVLSNKDIKKAARELVEAAKKSGGRDNVTVIIIDVCPKGVAAKALHNKVIVGCLTAAIIAGAATGAWHMLKPEEPSSGIAISELNDQITTAKNLKEAIEGTQTIIQEIDKSLEFYNGYSSSVDESDDAVKAANNELKAAITTLQEKRTAYANKVQEIQDGKASEKQKTQQIKDLLMSSEYIELETAQSTCETKKNDVESALKAWEDWKAEQERLKKEKEKEQKEKKVTDKPGGSNNSGSNTGRSNTGGSNTGGSNTGGSNTGGSNTGGSNTGGSNTGGSNTGGSNTDGGNTGGGNTDVSNDDGSNDGGYGDKLDAR